uniref:Secreted protein n=1 Tax=Anopheles darlingi TaxID=43151 RepID=A0A2M4D7A0_ANODA
MYYHVALKRTIQSLQTVLWLMMMMMVTGGHSTGKSPHHPGRHAHFSGTVCFFFCAMQNTQRAWCCCCCRCRHLDIVHSPERIVPTATNHLGGWLIELRMSRMPRWLVNHGSGFAIASWALWASRARGEGWRC